MKSRDNEKVRGRTAGVSTKRGAPKRPAAPLKGGATTKTSASRTKAPVRSSARSAALNEDDKYTLRPGVVAIYAALFNPKKRSVAKSLSKQLQRYAGGGSPQPLFAFFKRLSGNRSPFGVPDFDTFLDLFDAQKPLAPHVRQKAPAIDALTFWHQMVTGPVDDVVALSKLLHNYKVDASSKNLQAVASFITEVKKVPFDTTNAAHLKSVVQQLVEVSVEKGAGFQYLRWWELAQNMW